MPTNALNGVPVPRKRSNPTRRPNTPRPSLLGFDAVAEWLGVEVVFVRRLVAERRIPFVKIGKFVRFDPAEISAWIDGQRVKPVTGPPASGPNPGMTFRVRTPTVLPSEGQASNCRMPPMSSDPRER